MHAVLAFSTVPLFLGALLSDWAYAETAQVQWTNFASWLIAGALVFTGIALLLALVDALGAGLHRLRGSGLYLLLLMVTFVLGFTNALVHARDAWAAMPAAPVLSVMVLLVALAASGVGLAGVRRRDRPMPAGGVA